jgi:hypothetical protein
MATKSAARLWLGVVGSIRVDFQDHVGGMVTNGCVWMRGTVVKKFGGIVCSALSAFGLL